MRDLIFEGSRGEVPVTMAPAECQVGPVSARRSGDGCWELRSSVDPDPDITNPSPGYIGSIMRSDSLPWGTDLLGLLLLIFIFHRELLEAALRGMQGKVVLRFEKTGPGTLYLVATDAVRSRMVPVGGRSFA